MILRRSKPCAAACFSRIERTSSTIGSFHMSLFLQQRLWSANHWALTACCTANLRDLGNHHRIGQMRAVPRHKEIHLVYRCHRDMRRIRRSPRWNHRASDKQLSQRSHLVRNLQYGNALKQSKAFFRGLTIPASCLVDHELRNEKIKPCSAFKPPLSRNLLVGRDDQVSGRARGQIARDRRLYIDFRFHPLQCARKAGLLQENWAGYP